MWKILIIYNMTNEVSPERKSELHKTVVIFNNNNGF